MQSVDFASKCMMGGRGREGGGREGWWGGSGREGGKGQ